MRKTTIKITFIPQGATRSVTKSIGFENRGCRLYFNAQHLLTQLGSEARAFFDYLTEKMDQDSNDIIISQGLRNEFTAFITRVTNQKATPTDGSLTQYVVKLKKLGLLIPRAGKGTGYYCVNPKYVFKSSEKKRAALLKRLIEDRIRTNQSLLGLINTSENELLSN